MNGRRLLIIAATGNAHKLEEFRSIFSGCFQECAAEVISQKQAGEIAGKVYISPDETGASFAENAFIKSSSLERFMLENAALSEYAASFRAVCVTADDSGLCVDALGGAPGIYSARYASAPGSDIDASDDANVDKLLSEMKNVPDAERTAAFHCHISAIMRFGDKLDSRVRVETCGSLEGKIAYERRGNGGFGYDPVMLLPGAGKTVAELAAAEKNRISHRGKALRSAAGELYGSFAKLS